MRRVLAQHLDRWVIKRATARLEAEQSRTASAAGPKQDAWPCGAPARTQLEPVELNWAGDTAFQFQSPQPSPWPENNVVWGHLYRADPRWNSRPSVVLLHGWRGERQYRWQFPWLARCLNRRGINAALFQLPLHGSRRPRHAGTPQDWIWPVPGCASMAAIQALAETEALVAWLAAQGSSCVGVWGFSLGGWLTGLLACRSTTLGFAVLFCPVTRMDRAVERLPFCAPLRPVAQQGCWDWAELDLSRQQPKLSPGRLLLVAARYDLFVPPEEIEALAQHWGQPELWRLAHGHISALLAPFWLRRVVDWIARQAHTAYAGGSPGTGTAQLAGCGC